LEKVVFNGHGRSESTCGRSRNEGRDPEYGVGMIKGGVWEGWGGETACGWVTECSKMHMQEIVEGDGKEINGEQKSEDQEDNEGFVIDVYDMQEEIEQL
jgi:hypothetical protein